ncbi:MAG: signal peptide peptidase SppA [Deltaproteobacteria bacterium]|nr:signal peptide peptidase SppA [Deltaproteobacteria bacterium]
MLSVLFFGLTPLVFAQEGRLQAPGGAVSAEDGAAALWVNPANLGFDPDAAIGFWARQQLTTLDSSVALATTAGGTGLGLTFHADETGTPWWGLNSAFSVRLPQNLRLGANLAWHLPSSGGNFTAWDLGLGWRPLSWLGFGAVARNIGSPAPTRGITAGYAASATLRPFDEKLELSIDYGLTEQADLTKAPDQTFSAILRSSPVNGLVLRARADTDPEFSYYAFSGGLEVYFGGLGGGAWVSDNAQAVTGYVVSGPLDANLFGAGESVPLIRLNQAFAYQSQAGLFGPSQESYLGLLERLRVAATDPAVEGLVITVDSVPFSFAQIQELQAAIAAIRAQGKPVVAYIDGAASNSGYALAAACDKVYLHPAGEVDLIGLSAEMNYLQGSLDLVGVEAQYAKRAEFKSAPEQWTNTEASEPARTQMNALMDDLFAALVDSVVKGRGMTEAHVKELIDGGPYTAAEALKLGLVDGLLYPDEVEEELEGVLPKNYELDDEYRSLTDTSGWVAAKEVAIIYIDGPITSGESAAPGLLGGGGNAGSATIVRALIHAAESSSVKAVVLRVDSPGGSAFASDEIWRAVEMVQEEGKPVIASFGGVAASGGYYVAAGADAIYAEPATITGSIGVYGGKFSFGELMGKVGIGSEVYQRGRNAGMYSLSRPMDPIEYAAMDRLIEETYRQFKSRVSEGRGMTMEEVDAVARGRVWSGTDAKEVGLVDELGGLQDAITRAKLEAGLDADDDVTLVTLKGREGAWGEPVMEGVRAWAMGPMPPLPEPLLAWAPYAPLAGEHIFALMPYQIEVK